MSLDWRVFRLSLLYQMGAVECLYFKTINFADAGALVAARLAGRLRLCRMTFPC
jgi:hypothetical protein